MCKALGMQGHENLKKEVLRPGDSARPEQFEAKISASPTRPLQLPSCVLSPSWEVACL